MRRGWCLQFGFRSGLRWDGRSPLPYVPPARCQEVVAGGHGTLTQELSTTWWGRVTEEPLRKEPCFSRPFRKKVSSSPLPLT